MNYTDVGFLEYLYKLIYYFYLMFSQSNHVNLKDAKETSTQDYEFFTSPEKVKNLHKVEMIRRQTIDKLSLDKSFEAVSEKILDKDIVNELLASLKKAFESVSPLIYLLPDQQEMLLKSIHFIRFPEKGLLYNYGDKEDLNCYILLEGEMHIYNKKNVLTDVLTGINLFGYQGPIFKKRTHTVIIEQDSIVGTIPKKEFLEILRPFSKFSKFISRNILNKDKTFAKLDDFKSFVLNNLDNGRMNMELLIKMYLKIKSCLHTKAKSNEIDYNAWSYAINRLPTNIFTTFTYILINKIPNIFSTKEKVALEMMPKVQTELRNRDVFRYMEGKSIVIVRELETDVLDFIANLCIHIVESKKLRHLLNSPLIIASLYENRHLPIKEFIDTLMPIIPASLDIKQLKKTFSGVQDIQNKLINILLHNEDYSVSLMKGIVNDRDPIENFIQNLWSESKKLLGINTHVDLVDDLVVDIMQGSKRTLINCISPHIYQNKDKIVSWAENEIKEGRLELKTKAYQNQKYEETKSNDLLMAYSFYYYEAFPEENKAKKKLEEEHGIVYITKTFSTGVATILINPNKFDTNNIDKSIGFVSPVSKNHLIIHIGYTFGAQSKEIIKPILLLFGSKARSLNIMGKAGGLTGKRTDILMSKKIFYDKTNDVSNLDTGDLDLNVLSDMLNPEGTVSKTDIHAGPMLTVSGTILQNEALLNYYKHVMGCIGLEMEGYFYAKEIESATKHLILQNKFFTRCFYYVSDLPLDPDQNLASEGDMVNWEEGVQSMNAIQRFILKQVLFN